MCRNNFVLVIWIITVILCASGCCTAHNPIGFTDFKPIYLYGEDGLKYELLAPYSIQQRIDSETDEDRRTGDFIQGLRGKFPADQKLNDYLQSAGKRMHEVNVSYIKVLGGIKADLIKSGGELYLYRSFDSEFDANYANTNLLGAPYTDEGWSILANGKIYKKF
jgi:hypothetical protein